MAARAAAAEVGASTLLIESGPWGTTCARVGCMPSKLLIAAGEAAAVIRRAPMFGVEAGEPQVDGPAVMARLRRERDRFVGSVLDTLAKLGPEDRLEGRARFVGPGSLAVEGAGRIEARAAVIATGSRSTVPPAFRDLGGALLTNETVFELADLPVSLAVIGAGPLGIELAQAFARLGVRVTVFDTGRAVAGAKDRETGAVARELIGREVTLRLGVETQAQAVPGGVEIGWRGEGSGSGRETFARVLVAAGRAPNLDGLGLDAAGLALDENGIPRFDRGTMRCGESAIFLAGDVDGDHPVLHEAADEGWIAGANAGRFPDGIEAVPRGPAFAITYTDPEVATVGPPLPALEEGGAVIGRADLSGSGRAIAMGRAAGLIKLAAERDSGRLLGGEIVGPGAEHLGHLLAWAVSLDLDAGALLNLPFYHPTLEESLR
ncbi:MAG: dihydrolipoyl dehydrogenase, partial [Methylobacteriaceae bacterium]|nr:dihydrolipoyl dehydrogenase [Methylobacteriaceae bacterium]